VQIEQSVLVSGMEDQMANLYHTLTRHQQEDPKFKVGLVL